MLECLCFPFLLETPLRKLYFWSHNFMPCRPRYPVSQSRESLITGKSKIPIKHESATVAWSLWPSHFDHSVSKGRSYNICRTTTLFLGICTCESHSVLSNPLWSHGLQSPWNSPGQNIGVGSHSLLQGILPTQRSKPGLPHCRWIL